jgi:hypothetical protein
VGSGGRLGRTPILRQAQDDTVACRASSNAETVASGDSFNVIARRFNVILSLSKDGRAEQVQL